MKILYLSLERDVELGDTNEIMYLDYKMRDGGVFHKDIYNAIEIFKPDLLLEREFNDGESKYVDVVSFVRDNLPNCKRVVWLIDSHCNLQWHLEYAPLFDYVFVAISKFQPIIASHLKSIDSQVRVFWLPLCYPQRSSKIKRNKSRVPFDIVFVGRWNDAWFVERTRLVNLLQEKYKDKFFAITDYANMEDYIRQGIISFNRSLSDDMNFRVFETIANGVELVTNDVPDLHLIKSLEERINIYHSDKELFKMIDYILDCKRENDVIINQIWVQRKHCLIHRHKEIIEMIKSNKQHVY